MNKLTSNIHQLLNKHTQLKQWLWFIGLWMLGFTAMLMITSPIKWLIHHCQ